MRDGECHLNDRQFGSALSGALSSALMASPIAYQPTIHDESNSHSTEASEKKVEDPEQIAVIQDDEALQSGMTKYKPFILGALALLILGWWVSSTVLPATRHRW
jgi:hypothetical protein